MAKKTLRQYLIGEWSWKRPFYSLVTIYLLLMFIAVFFTDRILFIPPPTSYTKHQEGIRELTTAEGHSLACYYLPASEGMPTLLWSHGNAEDIGLLTPVFKTMHQAGFGVFAYDYPGYGLSSGRTSEQNCYQAIDLVWQHLTGALALSSGQIIAVGQSVGSGPATYLASKQDVAGLILIAPFTSVYRVPFHYPIFPRDRFPNLTRIQKVTAPLMLIHGDQDEIIPHRHSEKLLNAHRGKNIYHKILGHGHNDLYSGNNLARFSEMFSKFYQQFIN